MTREGRRAPRIATGPQLWRLNQIGRLQLLAVDEATEPIPNTEALEAVREELNARGLAAWPRGPEPWPERRR